MTDTEWTPEARKIREAERAAARRTAAEGHFQPTYIDGIVDRLYPAPPPLHTYGRELRDHSDAYTYRRRSDGEWQYRSGREWFRSGRTDAEVRAFAAEVPLTDAECDALTLATWSGSTSRRSFIRAAYVRVMQGEVK